MSAIKFVSLAIFELLAFNTQKIRCHVTLATPLFENFFRGHVEILPGSMRAKFELLTFSHLGDSSDFSVYGRFRSLLT